MYFVSSIDTPRVMVRLEPGELGAGFACMGAMTLLLVFAVILDPVEVIAGGAGLGQSPQLPFH